jgi:hypothetical protein
MTVFIEGNAITMMRHSTNKPLWFALSSAILFAVLSLMLSTTTLAAVESTDPITLAEAQLKTLETRLAASDPLSAAELDEMQASLQVVRQVARNCLHEVEQAQTKLDRELKILDPASAKAMTDGDGTAAEQKTQASSSEGGRIADLNERISALKARRSSCQLLQLQRGELEDRLDEARQDIFARQLMQRGANLLELIEQNLAKPGAWLDFARQILVESTGVHVAQGPHLAGMVLLGLLGWVAGLLIRRRLRPQVASSTGEEELSQGLYCCH